MTYPFLPGAGIMIMKGQAAPVVLFEMVTVGSNGGNGVKSYLQDLGFEVTVYQAHQRTAKILQSLARRKRWGSGGPSLLILKVDGRAMWGTDNPTNKGVDSALATYVGKPSKKTPAAAEEAQLEA